MEIVPQIGTKFHSDVVKVDGQLVNKKIKESVYIAFNKPVGIVCTTDTRVEKDNIIDFINYPLESSPFEDWIRTAMAYSSNG